jgi:hypothetical protein
VILRHELRGRLHSLRLHLTFLQRALAGGDPEVVESSATAMTELGALEQLVLELIARQERT